MFDSINVKHVIASNLREIKISVEHVVVGNDSIMRECIFDTYNVELKESELKI